MPAVGGVHAMTDVTGFGLLGHLLEMCRGASLGAEIDFGALPLFTQAQRLAEAGVGTGGAKRNWTSYGHQVDLPADAPDWWRGILCDPQTSGGLLIACSSDAVPQLLELLGSRNFDHATVVGEFRPTQPRIRVR
jgi:selenide,water dikinase